MRSQAGREDTPPLRRRGLPHDGLYRARRGDRCSARRRQCAVQRGCDTVREGRRERAEGGLCVRSLRSAPDVGLRKGGQTGGGTVLCQAALREGKGVCQVRDS